MKNIGLTLADVKGLAERQLQVSASKLSREQLYWLVMAYQNFISSLSHVDTKEFDTEHLHILEDFLTRCKNEEDN